MPETESNINATVIYIHYIQIRAWSLPDSTPCVIGQCTYACDYTLHKCTLLGLHIMQYYIYILHMFISLHPPF